MMKSTIVVLMSLICLVGAVAAADAGPVSPGVWYEFSFLGGVVAATGCSPADPAGLICTPSGGTPTTFADAPPWTFAAPAGGAVLTVTDAFLKIDTFDVFDFGVALGITSLPSGSGTCGSDPVPCLADPGASKGFYALGAGAHSITIVHALGEFGAAYFKWDPAVTAPVPGTAGLALLGFAFGLARSRRHR